MNIRRISRSISSGRVARCARWGRDFLYRGVPHSLRFHWLFMEGSGRGTDMRYVYSPLRGLVEVYGNE